jgi:hypothetical protein
MERITPATIPRPQTALDEGSRLAYSTSSTPGTFRGFLKPSTTSIETITATGMLRVGKRLVAITATREHELQNSIRRHTCAGCRRPITTERVTTATEGHTPYEHYSSHHHWHEACFKESESGRQEHALGRWAYISWVEN